MKHGCLLLPHGVPQKKMLDYQSAGYSGTFHPMQCDISDLAKVQKLFQDIKSDPDLEGVDVCINNAGIALSESFLTGDPKAWKQMFDVRHL